MALKKSRASTPSRLYHYSTLDKQESIDLIIVSRKYHNTCTSSRLYHYSTTCLPMPPHAILQESTEDEVDPQWLITKMCQMIDEFSDVNEGEKEFMKMWNIHVQVRSPSGLFPVPAASRNSLDSKPQSL